MGRSPCCAKEGLNRGAWTATEDKLLVDYISTHGEGRWRSIPKEAGLKRCGKSCRLRWLNYLRPDIKRGNITPDEDDLIIRLHKLLGNRWSLIAGRLPGRTDNEIKNYWNTTLLKRIQGGEQPLNPNPSKGKNKAKKRPSSRAKPAPQPQSQTKPEATSKAVRTKAVRCSKAVMIMLPPQLKNVDRNTEYGLENMASDNTSPTTSGEDYSALDSLPIEISGVFAPGEDPLSGGSDPLSGGSDPDFWSMLNDWIMDNEDPNCHS